MKHISDKFSLRSAEIDGETWFAGVDVAAGTGVRDTKRALAQVPDHYKRVESRGGSNPPLDFSQFDHRVRQITMLSEPGLYYLIMRSNKPEAQQFQRWVVEDVLPSIRRDGTYIDEEGITAAQARRAQVRLEGIAVRKEFTDTLKMIYERSTTSGTMSQWMSNFTKMMTKKALGMDEATFKLRKAAAPEQNFRNCASAEENIRLRQVEEYIKNLADLNQYDEIKAMYADSKEAMGLLAAIDRKETA